MKPRLEIETIDKYEVSKLSWPKENLLTEREKLVDVMVKLKMALILSNTEKIKCKIIFKDQLGLKMTETTIWAVCEKNILLKAGIWIPIRRIVDIII